MQLADTESHGPDPALASASSTTPTRLRSVGGLQTHEQPKPRSPERLEFSRLFAGIRGNSQTYGISGRMAVLALLSGCRQCVCGLVGGASDATGAGQAQCQLVAVDPELQAVKACIEVRRP